MEDIELFDDLIDIKSAFPVSEEEAKERKLDETSSKKKEEIKTNTLEVKLPEPSNEDEENEEDEEFEDSHTKVEEKEEDSEDFTEEEKETFEQVKSLKEIGALFLPDDYEVESLEKAIKDSDNYRNTVALNTVFNKIPDIDIPGLGNAKDLFVYVYEHGGSNLEDFKNTFGDNSFNPTNYNLQEETDRRKVLELYYSKKGFNDAKTKKLVDKIFDDFEDESEATEALGELVKIDAQNKQAHLAELEQNKIKKEQLAKEEYNNQLNILKTKDTIGGYTMGKDEKPKALNSLYTKVNVAGKEMSDFDYRLNAVVLRNPELTLALSAFLNTLNQDKEGNINFDLSKFERKEKTKAVRNLKEDVSRIISGKRKLNSSSEDNTRKSGFSWDNVVDYGELL